MSARRRAGRGSPRRSACACALRPARDRTRRHRWSERLERRRGGTGEDAQGMPACKRAADRGEPGGDPIHCSSRSVPTLRPPCQKPQARPPSSNAVRTMVNHGMLLSSSRCRVPRAARRDRGCPRAGNAASPCRWPAPTTASTSRASPAVADSRSRAAMYRSRSAIRRRTVPGCALGELAEARFQHVALLEPSISSSPTSSSTNRPPQGRRPAWRAPTSRVSTRRA